MDHLRGGRESSTWEYAALAALVAAIVLSGKDMLRGRLRVLDMAGIVFFAVLSVLALALDRGQLIWLETYAQVISNGLVAVVALGSLLVDPFTAQYAASRRPGSTGTRRSSCTSTGCSPAPGAWCSS